MDRELFLLLAFVYLAASQSCPEDQVTFGGKCYFYINNNINELSAEESCRNMGYNLVVINNDEENSFLQNILHQHHIVAFWLGIKRDDEWRTLPSNQPVKYTHWYPASDINLLQANCALIDRSGMWKNNPCDEYQASLICEHQASQDCSQNAEIFKGKQYLIGAFNANMSTSEDVCAYVGFEIVVINDAEENDYIRDYIARNNLTGGWLGVYWREPLTVLPNMEEARYTKWTSGYPRGDGECVYMDSTGYWKNIWCENQTQAVVMCQKNQAGHDCPENVEVFRGNRYLFGAHPVSFTTAMDSCGYLGFEYVVIDDAEENNAIRDYMTEKELTGGWIGVYWDGSRAFLIDYETARYTNWAAGYPSGDGECVYVDSTGYWKNILCRNQTQAVVMCEKESGMTQSAYSR